ncbi:MAG: hypothetical protein AAB578_04255, partial [Elusimicrobiota bacterium]
SGSYTLRGRAMGFEAVSYGPVEVIGDIGTADAPGVVLPELGYGGVASGVLRIIGDTRSRGAFKIAIGAMNLMSGQTGRTEVELSPGSSSSSETWRISGLSDGEYRLFASLEGFEPAVDSGAPKAVVAGGTGSGDIELRQNTGRVRATLLLPPGSTDFASVELLLEGGGTSFSTSATGALWESPSILGTGKYRLLGRYGRTGAMAEKALSLVSGKLAETELDLRGAAYRVSGKARLNGSVSLNLGTYTYTAGALAELAGAAGESEFCGMAYGGCISTASLRM